MDAELHSKRDSQFPFYGSLSMHPTSKKGVLDLRSPAEAAEANASNFEIFVSRNGALLFRPHSSLLANI